MNKYAVQYKYRGKWHVRETYRTRKEAQAAKKPEERVAEAYTYVSRQTRYRGLQDDE